MERNRNMNFIDNTSYEDDKNNDEKERTNFIKDITYGEDKNEVSDDNSFDESNYREDSRETDINFDINSKQNQEDEERIIEKRREEEKRQRASHWDVKVDDQHRRGKRIRKPVNYNFV